MDDSGTYLVESMRSMRPDALSLSEFLQTDDPVASLTDADGLSLHDTLGVGGSSVVRVGRQKSLDREVAVKQPKTEKLRWLLIREARITGRLQHPNILPVHDIVRSEHGDPLILMKRIGGQTWTAHMKRENLDGNLRILLQVCNAVAFAHSQGIVHRDLKPDNVMVGEFGEVVLLDWGLAVRTEALDLPWVPLAGVQSTAAGTPAFMAPEMVGTLETARARGIPCEDLPSPGPVGPQTDVFLLGAMLHTVLAGQPPHEGRDLYEILCSAWACRVEPPRGPDGLVAIAQRAMRRQTSERYPTAEDFRDAIERYLDHKAAVANAELALSRRDADGAMEALSELEHPPRELLVRVNALQKERLGEEKQRRFLDKRTGMGTRRFVLAGMGVVWTVLPLAGFFSGIDHGYLWVDAWTLGFLALAGLLVFYFRHDLARTQANQMVAHGLIWALMFQLVLDVGAQIMEIPSNQAHVMHLLLWSVVQGAAGLVVHRGLRWVSVSSLMLFLVASMRPDLLYLCMGVANGVLTAVVLVVWCRTEMVDPTR